jgi:large subunit ribosomal protein L2
VNDQIVAGNEVEIKIGNAMPLKAIPVNTQIHNIEMREGKGGQVARSAGNFAIVQAKEGDYVLLKFPSGEIRNIRSGCYATIGMLGNLDHQKISVGKAGRSRWLGIRSHVRGVAMNPVDHPMGGGEGKTSGGGHPVSPWGQKSKGLKTRKKKKSSSKYIVKRRK